MRERMEIRCPKCKHEMKVEVDELINIGRQQMKQEILKLMEKNYE